MVKIKSFLIILTILIINKLESYIEEAHILTNGKINVVLLGDKHLKNEKSKKQVYDTFKAIKELNALLIIEDKDWDVDNLEIPEKAELKGELLNIQNYLSPLGYLCKTSSIDCKNVEFRSIWDAFDCNLVKLEDAINKTKATLNDLKNSEEIKFTEECQNFENDPKWAILDKYKDLKIDEFLTKVSIDELYNLNNMSFKKEGRLKKLVAKICQNKLKNNFWGMCFPYLKLADPIIDAQILKEIFKNKNKKNIFVCTGSYHMRLVKKYLEEYFKFKTINSANVSHRGCYYSFNACYCYCSKLPVVLDIEEFLQDFIDQNKKETADEVWVY